MGKTREIKKRIKAVGNIRRITKTMQMIATSKFARAQQRAVATKPYTEGVFDLVRQIAAVSSATHPLLNGPSEKPKVEPRPLTLVITSDRGLCGPYNGSILRNAMAFFRENSAAKVGFIEVVGKKGAGFLRFAGIEPSEQHQFGDKVGYETIESLAQSLMDRFVSGEVSVVNVIFMRFVSAGRQRPEVMQLLPLKPSDSVAAADASAGGAGSGSVGANVEYEFSPEADTLLGSLLPAAVKATLFQAFNDAIVSEHVARMVAMKAATDNAGKMGKNLTRQFNRARQAQITTELTEIISGAAALN